MNNSPLNHEKEFDQLLASYREACEAPEASADFMPRLWERIESRQSWWSGQAWKWANSLVAAAAMASLFFVMLQMLPRTSGVFTSATYLETLADAHDDADAMGDMALATRGTAPQEQPGR